VAYVPQKSSIDWDFPATVYDTVMMGTYANLGWIKRPNRACRQNTLEVLRKVGMLEHRKKQISELSNGQRQRVFLARALVQEASVYLLDEPFIGVDQDTERIITSTLQELRDSGKTVLVASHDLQTVKGYFDMVCLMNVRLIALGAVDKVLTPENLALTYGAKSSFLSMEQFSANQTVETSLAEPSVVNEPEEKPKKTRKPKKASAPIAENPTEEAVIAESETVAAEPQPTEAPQEASTEPAEGKQ
jgi:manganese/zinc/iron transport system ATP- binding protein